MKHTRLMANIYVEMSELAHTVKNGSFFIGIGENVLLFECPC